MHSNMTSMMEYVNNIMQMVITMIIQNNSQQLTPSPQNEYQQQSLSTPSRVSSRDRSLNAQETTEAQRPNQSEAALLPTMGPIGVLLSYKGLKCHAWAAPPECRQVTTTKNYFYNATN